MRGKYKRKRLNKKYKDYLPKFKYWRENSYKFAGEMLGVRLNWWQKIISKIS